jgi:hypothetical protein
MVLSYHCKSFWTLKGCYSMQSLNIFILISKKLNHRVEDMISRLNSLIYFFPCSVHLNDNLRPSSQGITIADINSYYNWLRFQSESYSEPFIKSWWLLNISHRDAGMKSHQGTNSIRIKIRVRFTAAVIWNLILLLPDTIMRCSKSLAKLMRESMK